jgi:hypothetical protein
VSQVTVVQTLGSAVAPVNGPPVQVMVDVCPVAGALSVPLGGVAARAIAADRVMARNTTPRILSRTINCDLPDD